MRRRKRIPAIVEEWLKRYLFPTPAWN